MNVFPWECNEAKRAHDECRKFKRMLDFMTGCLRDLAMQVNEVDDVKGPVVASALLDIIDIIDDTLHQIGATAT